MNFSFILRDAQFATENSKTQCECIQNDSVLALVNCLLFFESRHLRNFQLLLVKILAYTEESHLVARNKGRDDHVRNQAGTLVFPSHPSSSNASSLKEVQLLGTAFPRLCVSLQSFPWPTVWSAACHSHPFFSLSL